MAAATSLEHDLKLVLIALLVIALSPQASHAELNVLIVEGLGGEPQYAERFDNDVTAIEQAAVSVTSAEHIKVLRRDDATRDAILAHFESLKSASTESDQFVVYLIGHGSFDEYQYKFNLPGPDLTGEDIASALNTLPAASQVLINTSSSSGAILELLENENRTVVSATRSGVERHATHFGRYFVEALSEPGADLDKNRLISVQEAFDFAERQVGDYFEGNGQLATEHARLEGDRATRMTLARLDTARPEVSDRILEELNGRRVLLNADIEALRNTRPDMSDEEYRRQLLEKMLELAQVEDSIESRQAELDAQ